MAWEFAWSGREGSSTNVAVVEDLVIDLVHVLEANFLNDSVLLFFPSSLVSR